MSTLLRRGPIAWMAEHPVASNLLLLLCLIGGVFSFFITKREVFPDITRDVVRVSMSYPGASPEEVEQGIVLAIEESVRGLDAVYHVESTASEGRATVNVEMIEGEDLQKLAQDVQSEVDRIVTFPEEAEEPEVREMSRRREVLEVVVFGDFPDMVLHELGEQIRDQFVQDPDITQVEVDGLPSLEISIEIKQDVLRKYGLSVDEVASRLSSASLELPGGGLKTDGGEVLVRVMERRDYGREFALMPIITTQEGTEVLLGDIATIRDDFQDTDQRAMYNGKPAIILEVFRIGNQTPLQVEAAALRQMEELKPALPPGVEMVVLDNRAEIYRGRATLLLRNGGLGLILVLITLTLFLELRLAFWVMMGIPASFLGSLIILPHVDISINMISMFAYIVALGIVVDDAIVIGENIYYHHQRGLSFQDASIKGAQELAVPVTFSILTNIVTFLPIYFIPGTIGKIFKVIPVVVCIVFLISLFESIFVLPAHLGHHKERKRRGLSKYLHNGQQWFSRSFTKAVERGFGPLLDLALHHRYVSVAAAIAIFIITISFAGSGRMGFSMFPKTESDYGRVDITLPYGAPVEKTEAIMRQAYAGAEKVIEECGHPELLKGIYAEIGREGAHTAYIEVFLADSEIRDKIMSTDQFVTAWREAVGPLTGVDTVRFASDFGGPGHGAGLTVEFSHRDIGVLEQVSTEFAEILLSYPLCSDVSDGFQPGKQQIDFKITPKGKSLGMTARSVARQVRSAFYGAEVVRQQRGRSEVKIMVRLPEEERISEGNLDDLILRTPAGVEVPLREVVDSSRGRAYTTIDRRDGRRVVQVSASVTPRDRALEVQNDAKANDLPRLMDKYQGLSYSFEGRQADMRESMGSLKWGFLLALLAIFGLLAIPFRSYSQPLIIMVSIPFGIIGAVLGHLIMGYALSVVSMFGIVALSGVVVNDALVLIDAANRRRNEEGLNSHDAVLSAAIQRFRPILLTTVTTFCGLAPMIFETSRQARMMIPMAISLGFGILFATLITLLLIPSLYLVIDDIKRVAGWVWGVMFPAPAGEESQEEA